MRQIYVCMLLSLLLLGAEATASPTSEQFINRYFTSSGSIPLSFKIGKAASATSYKSVGATINDQAGKDYTLRTIRYTDKNGIAVEIEAKIYARFNTVEWVAHLKNNSKSNTPILSDIDICRVAPGFAAGNNMLYYARGSNGDSHDFEPRQASLKESALKMGTENGRSSDTDFMPFFNIASPTGGVVGAVGWTGNWSATISQSATKGIEIQAGFSRKMGFYLEPGEEIRTASMVLMFWDGTDRMIGHNQWRQMMLSYFTPQDNGKPLNCPITMPLGYNGPKPCVEFNCSSEALCRLLIDRSNQLDLKPDLWWIDAGWYRCSPTDWFSYTGSWTPDADRFPNGMKPVGDAASKYGQGFLMWFEPERVRKGTWLWDNKPEWMLKEGKDQALLDLGNPDAVKWISDAIIDYHKKAGLTWYRQDFNFRPVDSWAKNDKPGRVGISEIKHTTGLYRFWDNLREAGLFIDNCAAGGRRLDIETARRAIPLWRTDYNYCEPIGYQAQTSGISFFLPCHTTGTYKDPDPYRYRSGMTNGGVTTWDINQVGFDSEAAKAILAEHREIRDFFYGDFYPLSDYDTHRDTWICFQFGRPDQTAGMVLLFRRDETRRSLFNVKPRGLKADAEYEVFYRDYGVRITKTGAQLMNDGLEMSVKTRPASLLVTYQIKQ